MSLIFFLIPFAVVILLVLLIKIILNKKDVLINSVNVNHCTITAIPPAVFDKVSNIYSPPNEPFRPVMFSTCLEYLHNQKIDVGNQNENTILTCLGGKL